MTIINTSEEHIKHLENKDPRYRNVRDIIILECVKNKDFSEYNNPVISSEYMTFQWIDDILYQLK